METRVVDVITLEQALALAGPALPIRYLKIDAQGLDFKIIKRAPAAALKRVETVRIEVLSQNEACMPLYEGQERCQVVAEYMQQLGFSSMLCLGDGRCEHFRCLRYNSSLGCEMNVIFSR